MIVKKYVSPECSQSLTIHPNGDQAHSAILLDVNGVSYALMGFVIKNGEIHDTVLHHYTPKKKA